MHFAGLTARVAVTAKRPNPYTLASQAHLLLSLCQSLGLTRVLLAAHADGCLLALRAASMAARWVAGSRNGGRGRPGCLIATSVSK